MSCGVKRSAVSYFLMVIHILLQHGFFRVWGLHAGKVFGVHSGDGHVLWSRALGGGRRPTHLALWRTSHDAAAAPEVLLLGNVPSSGAAFFATLNAHTGAETSSGQLPFKVAQVWGLLDGLHPWGTAAHVEMSHL